MKFQKLLMMLLALSLVFGAKFTFAQDDEETKTEEMTEEQWQAEIDQYTAQQRDLMTKVADLQKEKDGLAKTLEAKNAEVKKAEENYWTAVGGKDSYDAFKNNLGKLETIVKNKEGTKADAEKMYATLSASNLRCHPDFAARYKKLGDDIKNWTTKVETPAGYTVVKGDCLWKIASKKEIYNNPRMWPVIWDANREGVISAPPRVSKTIHNPNLIYPGQVLRIPALTKELENSALQKSYQWRKHMRKRAPKTEGTVKTDEKKDVKKVDPKKDVKVEPKKDVKKVEPKK